MVRGQGEKKGIHAVEHPAHGNIHDSELKIIINKKGLTRTPCSEVRQY